MAKKKTELKKFCKKLRSKEKVVKENSLGDGDEMCTIKVTITPEGTLSDVIGAVNDIADLVISKENGKSVWEYIGGFDEIIKKYMLIHYYTDLPLTELEDMYTFCKHTSLYNDVKEAIGAETVEYIFAAADKVIGARLRYLEGQTTINEIITKIADVLDSIKNKIDKINPEVIQKVLTNISQNTELPTGALTDILNFMPQIKKETK